MVVLAEIRYVKNLRPITLLNTDYKVIEKAVANKMIPALEHIIHNDQRGFMKDRRISVNIRKMLDIMYLAEKQDLEAVVLSLDFVKCFDKCSFSILHGSLDFFQFGEIVRKWTQVLYNNFSVKIQNNGNFSDVIPIRKGVHQGGCCSSIYFLVIAEILALALRSNENIEGITFKDIQNILNQFADDMDIFSLASQRSLSAIFHELKNFKQQSGFTVSYDKTTLYRIGSLRHSSAKMYGIDEVAWSNQDITVLGVTISHEDILDKNYGGIVAKARKVLNAWNNRGLTLIGKIQVINALIASLFVYKMMVLPCMPKNIIKNLDNLMRDFLWNGKKAKIALKTLQNPKSEGGLNLVNFSNKEKALKATWPQILAKEEQYSMLVYNIMKSDCLQENIWRCRIHPDDISTLKIQSPFWTDVLRCWAEYNFYNNFRIENQYIWYNSSIKVKGKPFLWKDVCLRGLSYVYQLFHQGDFKSEEAVFEEYGLTVLRFNALKVAIPREWKEFFCTFSPSQYLPLPPHNYDLCLNIWKRNFSRRVYKFISEDVMIIHNKYIAWRIELGESICDGIVDFGKLHLELYKVTNVTKYRSFQYRLLQRGIVTNVQLYKWGLKPDELCTFCQVSKETLSHMFCLCPKILEIWESFNQYCQNRFKIHHLQLSASAILLNRVAPIGFNVINFLCLVTKQFIYRQRCMGNSVLFTQLVPLYRSIENVEKFVATKNGKIRVHNAKWLCHEKFVATEAIQQHIQEM